MRKFKTVNELVNSLKPDHPVYCIRPNEIKKSVKFFKDNFPGKVLYAIKTNPNEKIVNTVCESTKKIFGDYVLNISNAGTGPMHAFTHILSVPCISVGASYIFCRMHSPNEFAKIDLLHKTTKNICVLLEKFSRS